MSKQLTREQEIELAYAQLAEQERKEKDKVWDLVENKSQRSEDSLFDLALS
jgi:hypothetical protein